MNIQKILDDIRSDRVKKVIIDTDAANELDDQFAIAYALGSDKTEVLSINAAHFAHNGSDRKIGMEKSYAEIKRVLSAYMPDCKIPVYKGCVSTIGDNGGKPVESEAVKNIIDTARSSEETVYVLGIGTATNIASAIALCPEIKERIAVIWLGGNDFEKNDLEEYNLIQDYAAGQILLDSGVSLVLCPAFHVTSALYAPIEEFEKELSGKGPVCELLWQLVNQHWHIGYCPENYGRTIWDIAAVALLSKPECADLKIIKAPIFSEEKAYAFDDSRHEIIWLEKLDRDTVYADAWKNIKGLECTGEYIPVWDGRMGSGE